LLRILRDWLIQLTKYCKGCGRQLEDEDRFCDVCGKLSQSVPRALAAIAENETTSTSRNRLTVSQSKETSSRRNLTIAVALILIVLIGLVFSTIVLQPQGDHGAQQTQSGLVDLSSWETEGTVVSEGGIVTLTSTQTPAEMISKTTYGFGTYTFKIWIDTNTAVAHFGLMDQSSTKRWIAFSYGTSQPGLRMSVADCTGQETVCNFDMKPPLGRNGYAIATGWHTFVIVWQESPMQSSFYMDSSLLETFTASIPSQAMRIQFDVSSMTTIVQGSVTQSTVLGAGVLRVESISYSPQ